MPAKGFGVLTIRQDFIDYVRKLAEEQGKSPQRVIEEKFGWSRKK